MFTHLFNVYSIYYGCYKINLVWVYGGMIMFQFLQLLAFNGWFINWAIDIWMIMVMFAIIISIHIFSYKFSDVTNVVIMHMKIYANLTINYLWK